MPAKTDDLLIRLEGAQQRLRSASADLRERLLAERDAVLDELLEAQRAPHNEARDQHAAGAFDAKVAERAALVERAKRVLPELRADGMSDRQLHEAVLKRVCGAELDLRERSDDYVRGYFEQRLASGRIDSTQPQPEVDPRQLQLPHVYQPAWRQALRASKSRLGVTGPEVVRADAGAYRQPAWREPLHTSTRSVDQIHVRA